MPFGPSLILKMYPLYRRICTLVLLLIPCVRFSAQISIASVPFTGGTTDFNNYNPNSQSNALATIPAGWSFSCTGTNAFFGQTASAASTAGGYYAYNLLSDVNLGALRDASSGFITYKVDYVNNSGVPITDLVISWDYEQWKFSNTSCFDCSGTGALSTNTFLTTRGCLGASSSFLNLPISVSVPAFTLSGLSIPSGATFGIAWTTNDVTGADNGVSIDNFSLDAFSTASITIATGAVSGGSVYQSSANNVVYRSDVTIGLRTTTLTAAQFSMAGSYSAANLNNLKLWYSPNSVFSSTATLLGTKTGTIGPGIKTFNALSQALPVGPAYFFLTADLACSGLGNTLFVQPISLNSFTFANGNKNGSGFTAGGTQTITAMQLLAVSSRSTCSGKSMAAVNFTALPSTATATWSNSNTGIGLAASGSNNIAAFVTNTVASNTTGIITATAMSGACTGNSISFNLVVRSNGQSISVWTGSVSGDWADADNWSNCACTGVTDATVVPVTTPAFNPTLSVGADVKNLTIASGATLAGVSGRTLTLRGNWLNNGFFDAQGGVVSLNGTSQQSLSGSAVTVFDDVVLSNSNGALLGSAQQIRDDLFLLNGTLNTSGLLTILSTGRIGPISASADITNNVTIEQLAPGGSTGWALLGSSLSSGMTLSGWNDDFAITCLSCPDGYSNSFTSVYSYNETAAGSYSAPAKYTAVTSISDGVANGRGYWVYLGNGYPNTSDISFDVTGPVAKSTCLSCSSPVSIPLSFTSNNGINDDGWNLIANPLPSPISWTALRNGNASVDNAIYVYNTDLNSGAGAHTSYVNGVSSNPGSGIGDEIAIHQGFYVHATAVTQLTASENVKVDANPVFLRPAQVARPLFRVVMKDNNLFEDMTTFYFEQGGALSFQPDFDAYKLNFDDSTIPYLASTSGSLILGINGLPPLNSNYSVSLKAISPQTNTFVFSSLQEDFPNNVCVTLYDMYTGTTTNLLADSYTCTLYDTTTVSRFTVNFFTGSSTGSSSVQQPDCADPESGLIIAMGAGAGPWNYEWKNSGGTVKTSVNKNSADSLSGIAGGTFTVTVSTVGQCDLFAPSFVISSFVATQADFLVPALIDVSDITTFYNVSFNNDLNAWNFGDGLGSSTQVNPSYKYSSPGIYTVTLITKSSTNCSDTTSQVLMVKDLANALSKEDRQNEILLENYGSDRYGLKLLLEAPADVELQLLDARGTLLRKNELKAMKEGFLEFDMTDYAPGMYLLQLRRLDSEPLVFKILR